MDRLLHKILPFFFFTFLFTFITVAQNTNNRENKITNVKAFKEIKQTETQSNIVTDNKIKNETKIKNDFSKTNSNSSKKIDDQSSDKFKTKLDPQKRDRSKEQAAKEAAENNITINAAENSKEKQTIINSEIPTNWEANTTAVKISDDDNSNNNSTSEKVPQKVTVSENYSPRKIKEDMQPAVIESNKISTFKKSQLEEEAIQIQKIMNENKSNPEFNKTFYKNKLYKIKELLK